MRKKKLSAEVIAAVVISIVVLGDVLAIWFIGRAQNREEYTTLEEMAYDKSGRKTVVYIKENDEYVPYLVLESDYGGNVLLLRENVLPEPMQYQPSPHGESTTAFGAPWERHDYGSYYEKSSIDKYLSTDFKKVFSPAVQEAIVTSTIEVTDMESYDQKKWAEATHMIERKVFLLSAVELGITFGVDYTITREGTPLKYFKNTEHSVKKAYAADGTAWHYWTRTPWIGETYDVTVIGVIYELGTAPADSHLGVRPAFCLGKDTVVQKSDSVIEGKSVYILELETE
ncbi:MAG: hypothetical protein K2K10_07305 [Acetatifactor sp.]|nr:hypothetical protein [Acetatifactor sp.]